jgi:hypothetical protein
MSGTILERLRASALKGRLAPAAAGYDYLARPWLRESWGGPLNDQAFRRLILESVISKCGVHAVVETGSYRGTSTDYFRCLPGVTQVWTVEAIPRFFWYTRIRFRRDARVKAIRGDSRSVLLELARNRSLTSRATLFYLDAHWDADLPLGEEVQTIAGNWRTWVAIIDDFRVPGDDGYGYDSYGPAATLDVDYLLSRVPGLAFYFPALPSHLETGLRRGCAVVTTIPEVRAQLDSLPLLLRQHAARP